MKLWLAAALLAASFGCATVPPPAPGAAIQMGGEVAAPGGYEDLCHRDPALSECGGAR